MPETGSEDGASVLAWLKQPGDQVAAEEPICLVTWADVTAEVTSPAAGVMRMLALAPGSRATAGGSLAIIDVGVGGPAVAPAPPPAPAVEAPPSPPLPSEGPRPSERTQAVPEHLLRDAPVAEPRRRDPATFLSPAVRRFLGEHERDPSEVAGSGQGGRVSLDDLRRREHEDGETGA
jgi:2-oxoglutarate dehydrogenase E2 component (dihydrolipoamide succinyltransferase)